MFAGIADITKIKIIFLKNGKRTFKIQPPLAVKEQIQIILRPQSLKSVPKKMKMEEVSITKYFHLHTRI